MAGTKAPFLSIIIPTKNRQYTCIYAVQSALLPGRDDIEVIVQDCSDTNILEGKLKEKFNDDARIKYLFVESNPSMTENWNAAYARASGTYMCGIGDDDGIFPVIYDAAKWGEANDLMCITHSNAFTYNWPDFASHNLRGVAIQNRSNLPGFEKRPYDEKGLLAFCHLDRPLNYSYFPMVYHNLTHRSLYNQICNDYGKFLGATSVDVYSVFSYHKYLKHSAYGYSGAQFTIRGASGASNSSRFNNGKIAEHFSEFRDKSWPVKYLPYIQNLYSTVAESMINACLVTGQESLINEINFPMLYANMVITSPSSEKEVLEKYLENDQDRKRFSTHLSNLTKAKSKISLNDITNKLPIPLKLKHRLYELKSKHKVYTGIHDIVSCINMITNRAD